MKPALKLMVVALCGTVAPLASRAHAAAGFLVDFGAIYYQGGDGNYGQGNFDVGTTEHLDLIGAYHFQSGLLLGVQYLSSTSSGSNAAAGGTASYDLKTTAWGAAVGWADPKGGLSVTAAYLIDPATTNTSTNTPTGGASTQTATTLSGTSGYVIDVGYHYPFGNWGAGPVISYRSYTYQKSVVNGVQDSAYNSASEYLLTPLFSVQYEFDR